jgi:hypothetical protein
MNVSSCRDPIRVEQQQRLELGHQPRRPVQRCLLAAALHQGAQPTQIAVLNDIDR